MYYFFILAFLLIANSANAQYFEPYPKDNIDNLCNLANQQNPTTSITFYGDSRGDFVSDWGYGESASGWIPYFNFGSQQNWNIQNLAVGGQDSMQMYDMIINCTVNPNRTAKMAYKTATRYAFEIGGNDAIHNWFTLVLTPWNFPKFQGVINQRQLAVAELLKMALLARLPSGTTEAQAASRILMMGSYPAVSHGPITGLPAEGCFKNALNNNCVPILADRIANGPGQEQVPTGISMENLLYILNSTLYGEFLNKLSIWIQDGLKGNVYAEFQLLTTDAKWVDRLFGKSNGSTLDELIIAWQHWVTYVTEGSSHATVVSMMLEFITPGEQALSDQSGINYLPLFHTMVSAPDCFAAACYVANQYFFRDLIHPNWVGYGVLGPIIGKWLANHNWQTVDYPPTYAENIADFLLLIDATAKIKAKADQLQAWQLTLPLKYHSKSGYDGYCQDFDSPGNIFGPITHTICYFTGNPATPNTQAFETHGDIRIRWLDNNGGPGWLGFPTSDEMVKGTDRCSNFENGHLYWHWTRYIEPDTTGGCPAQ